MSQNGRNIRISFLSSLGFQNIKEIVESQLRPNIIGMKKNDNFYPRLFKYQLTSHFFPPDVEHLKRISLSYGILLTHRKILWKVFLGLWCPYRVTWEFLDQQRNIKYSELKRTAILLMEDTNIDKSFESFSNQNLGHQISIFNDMYKIQHAKLKTNFFDSSEFCLGQKCFDMIFEVFYQIPFETAADRYDCLVNFLHIFRSSPNISSSEGVKTVIPQILKKSQVLIKKKDIILFQHLKAINSRCIEQAAKKWLSTFFVTCFSDIIFVWDRFIASSIIHFCSCLIYCIIVLECRSTLLEITDYAAIESFLLTWKSPESSKKILPKTLKLYNEVTNNILDFEENRAVDKKR
ncbi:uncharacterized protein LOC126326237 [Schistocerca gregaria]|uniref:uncharacterized protein LOC126326237 n=1 Tax=Schistocerca gregaria TaxID=7010 RepID=UPI00211E442A|nr:uncharacterized protein LOC126326237 [Schistocerca gregaria]